MLAQVTAVCISLTAAAIKGSEPVEVSYIVPTSVLGPTAGVIDGEPILPVIAVGFVRVKAVPASTAKGAAVPRSSGPGPLQLAAAGGGGGGVAAASVLNVHGLGVGSVAGVTSASGTVDMSITPLVTLTV